MFLSGLKDVTLCMRLLFINMTKYRIFYAYDCWPQVSATKWPKSSQGYECDMANAKTRTWALSMSSLYTVVVFLASNLRELECCTLVVTVDNLMVDLWDHFCGHYEIVQTISLSLPWLPSLSPTDPPPPPSLSLRLRCFAKQRRKFRGFCGGSFFFPVQPGHYLTTPQSSRRLQSSPTTSSRTSPPLAPPRFLISHSLGTQAARQGDASGCPAVCRQGQARVQYRREEDQGGRQGGDSLRLDGWSSTGIRYLYIDIEKEMEVDTVDHKATKRKKEFLTDVREDEKFVKKEIGECGDAHEAEVFDGSNKKRCFRVKPSKSKRYEFSDAGHRRRLMRVLENFVRFQNWNNAGQVLCTLLTGADKDSHPMENQEKYWAAMEMVSQIDNECMYPLKIKRIYEVWMSKNRVLSKQSIKRNYLIQLEYVLFLLSVGNISEAHNSIKFLILDSESGSDPLVNIVAGFISYELWYLGISKEMQCSPSTIQTQSNFEEYHHGLNVKLETVECSVNCDTMKTQDPQTLDQYLSDGSVCNKRQNSMDACNSLPAHQDLSADGFHMKEGTSARENNASMSDCECIDGSIPFPYGLDASLLPIQIPLSTNSLDCYHYLREETNKEHYLNAVKYLQVALHSNPPVLPALVPLVQLLLLGDQVEEALNELRSLCHNSDAVLPYRLRASLLGCFSRNNRATISACYEDILKKDPTCRKSVVPLISMHKNGSYDTIRLIEMMALHLDATFATSEIWEEFASCLLKLQKQKFHYEDQISTNRCTSDADAMNASLPFRNAIHPLFMKDEVQRSWKLRCRWWAQRHFSEKARKAEVQSGEWELMTFKAASASHLYEPEFEYVQNVWTTLPDEGKILLLHKHFENSMKLAKNLN